MLGKARKDGITKTAFGKKRICDAIVVSFNFLFRVYYDQLKPQCYWISDIDFEISDVNELTRHFSYNNSELC